MPSLLYQSEKGILSMRNVYTMGNHHTKEDIYPAVVEFMRIKGGKITNGEIYSFIAGRTGIYFANISEVIEGLRDYDKRIVRVGRGVSQFMDEDFGRGFE